MLYILIADNQIDATLLSEMVGQFNILVELFSDILKGYLLKIYFALQHQLKSSSTLSSGVIDSWSSAASNKLAELVEAECSESVSASVAEALPLQCVEGSPLLPDTLPVSDDWNTSSTHPVSGAENSFTMSDTGGDDIHNLPKSQPKPESLEREKYPAVANLRRVIYSFSKNISNP